MKRRLLLSVLLLMSLCLAVPSVNAENVINIAYTSSTQTFNLGSISDLNVRISPSNTNIGFTAYNFNQGAIISNGILTLSKDYTSTSGEYRYFRQTPSIPEQVGSIIINYNYVEPTPEPTPGPTGAYLSSTLLSESNTGLTYQIKPMPDDGTYLFSRVNTGNPSAVDSTIIYSSEDAAINYKISRGTSQTFNCNYKEGYWGLPHTMSLTLSAPVYSEDVLINQSIVNNTLQNLPNPINPNPTTNNNAFVSGAWSPIGRDAVINSAFSNIVRNGGFVFSLPHMDSPAALRAGLLNNTGNITAPLYDFIDSVSSTVLFLPDVLGNAVGTVLNGISETVSIIKEYIDYLFGLLDNCMDFFYVLLPVIYILIPDAVWWCFTALLCYYIIKWILILILGYDVVSAYLTGSKKGED